MIRTQIQLEKDQFEKIKKVAMLRGISLAELVRQGVDLILERASGLSRDEVKKRAMALSGKFHSGQGNLSLKHDDHLAEAYKS
jgi:hypothetical protein